MELPVAAGLLGALGLALALAYKWELPKLRVGAVVGGLGLAVVGATRLLDVADGWSGAVVILMTTLLASAGVGAWRFYRDPERTPPDRDDVVVSPADGRVIYVRSAPGGALPVLTKAGRSHTLDELTKTSFHEEHAVVVGIALNFLDVHVNRSPVRGAVVQATRFPGRFMSLKRPEALFENERATFVIESEVDRVGVVLIASRLVRRIVMYVSDGDEVGLGQRIGAIRFGSQADVVIPVASATRILVQPGDRVVAGETILAER